MGNRQSSLGVGNALVELADRVDSATASGVGQRQPTPQKAPVQLGPMSLDPPPRFPPGSREALAYLEEHGYVVVAGVASPEQVTHAEDLLWQHLEATHPPVRRDNPASWGDSQWPTSSVGIINEGGIGQSDFLWFLRLLPGVHSTFAALWGTPDLLTSFDGCGVFRPTAAHPEWRTRGGWFHLDQNGRVKKGLHAVQGMVSVTRQSPATGGLVVIPGSHKAFATLAERCPPIGCSDYVPIPPHDPILTQSSRLVSCEAGDLVLWDSRTVHCNCPAPQPEPTQPQDRLLRVVAYVCMTPRRWASRAVLELRKEAFEENITTSHWPHEFCVATRCIKKPKRTLEGLPIAQLSLIGQSPSRLPAVVVALFLLPVLSRGL